MTATRDETIADLRTEIAALRAERDEALTRHESDYSERIAHQAATIDVLKAMSASPGDARPALETIARRAWALCGAQGVFVYSVDGPMIDIVVYHRPDLTAEQLQELQAWFSRWPRPVAGVAMAPAVTERRILHIRDIDAWPRASEMARRFLKSAIWVPLLRGDTVIGLIGIDSLETGGFSDSQVELLETFAEQAVIAIQSAETWRALQERTAELAQRNSDFGERIEQQAATIDVLKIMSSTPDDTKPVFDQIIRRAKELCNSSSAGLFEYRDGLVHYSGIHTDVDMNTPSFSSYVAQFPMVPTRDSMVCRVILDNQIFHIRDMEEQTDLSPTTRALVRDGLYRSFLGIPLPRDGQAIGCICSPRHNQAATPKARSRCCKPSPSRR
jgi:GAF domain-containing protein